MILKGVKHGLKWYKNGHKIYKTTRRDVEDYEDDNADADDDDGGDRFSTNLYLGYNCAQVNAPTPVQCVSAINPSAAIFCFLLDIAKHIM